MRISIALSLLVLAIGATLGWQDHQRLVAVQTIHDKLVAEAASTGITLDPAAAEDGVRVTKREREDKDAIARQISREFIAFAKEMEQQEKKGGQPDEEMQKKIFDMLDKLMSMDSSQLKTLIAEVRATPDLEDETRQGLIGFSIMTLSNDHPQAALTLFTESQDIFKDDGMGKQVVSSSLAKWAKDDPMAALAWIRENGEKHPDLVSDDARLGLISGAADQDPKLAFSLISELGLKDPKDAVTKILGTAKTASERSAVLAAFRDHLATITDANERKNAAADGARELAQSAAKEGFEAGSQWISDAGFSPEELGRIADGSFSYNIKREDTGKWVEWIGTNNPDAKSDNGIRRMVSNWTEKDYQAAGTWLSATPAGPTKDASVRAYAETVAAYEPATAAQWAMTLPAGKQREETLQNIYDRWPSDDEDAKAAFAKQHGIR